jgi:hypothetical protein
MNDRVQSGGEIVDYLLGDLSEERMEAIEQRILANDDFHLEVEAAETELLDKYVYGDLDARSRRLFRQNFLKSDVRRRKLQFAHALKDRLAAENPAAKPQSFLAYALAASILLVVGLGLANFYLTRRLSREQARVAELNRQIETARNSSQGAWSSQDAIVLARLQPAGERGGQLAEITVPKGVRAVQLVFDVPPDWPGKAQVQLLNDSGQVITTAFGIEPQEIGGKRLLIATFSTQYFLNANYFIEVVSEGPNPTRVRYALKVLGR